MKNCDSYGHVTGKSVYLDDIPLIGGTLFGAVYASQVACGKILSLDLSGAESSPGVVAVLTASSIPGENQIGGIIPDEPLFATDEVHYIGQPVALVIAKTYREARIARRKIRTEYLHGDPVTCPRKAMEKGMLLFPARTFQTGDVSSVWQHCSLVLSGKVETGAQEHLYLETQGAYAWPEENGNLTVCSSTQGITLAQRSISRVLNIPMHRITVDVRRLGGGFGGKEDQATAWAVMASLAAALLHKPVKLVLERHDDMGLTGKRHPYEADFTIGLSGDLKILGWEVVYYQNGGASTDLSPAILERTLFHSTNSYFIPHVKATAYSCKTNLPPNTAFRGFGAPQAIFIIESAIAMAAEKLGIPAWKIQKRNLISENDRFPYGQVVRNAYAKKAWKEACRIYHLKEQIIDIQEFNQKNPLVKKGLALMPVCFGISFTNTGMNQGMALVHIYRDGSIGISTGAIEMGQGVNTKMVQVAAATFSVSPGRIRIETTNTSRVANTSPTAASTGADLNGKAVIMACEKLLDRLLKHALKMLGKDRGTVAISLEMVTLNGIDTGITWDKLVESAFLNRIGLSESGHYATPVIHFDKTTEKGHPFSYYVFGTAIVTVTVDCLRGIYKTDQVLIVHDFGNSINMDIDKGQVEGAVVQGIGWMTMEEVRYNSSGKLLSDTLSTYKVPDIYSAPRIIECKALDIKGPGLALMGSKAVGEPPFIYGIGVWFAIRNAILAFNPSARIEFSAPLTPEKVLMALWNH